MHPALSVPAARHEEVLRTRSLAPNGHEAVAASGNRGEPATSAAIKACPRAIISSVRSRVLACAAAALALVAGCSSSSGNDSAGADAAPIAPVSIVGVQQLALPDCTASGSAKTPLLAAGTLDVSLADSYFAFVVLRSELPSAYPAEAGVREEPNRLNVEGADVTVGDEAGHPLATYSIASSCLLSAATAGAPAYCVAGVMLLPPLKSIAGLNAVVGSLAAPGRTTLNVSYRLFGTTFGGVAIETPASTFRITVCNGCSVVHAPGSVRSGEANTFNCDGTGGPPTESSCFRGQDASSVDCRPCQGVAGCTGCTVDADCHALSGARCNPTTHFCTTY